MVYSEKIEEILEILPSGEIYVKTVTRVLRDGLEIATTINISKIEPGDDLNGKSAEVIAHANVAFTPDKVAAKAAQKAADKAKIK